MNIQPTRQTCSNARCSICALQGSLLEVSNTSPVEPLAISYIRISPGKCQQHIPQLLDPFGRRGGIMFVVRQSPQEIQLNLFGCRILFFQSILKQGLEVPRHCAVLEFFHMEVDTPLPHLGAVFMWNPRPDEVLQFHGAHHLPVHGAGKVVFPFDSS